MSQASDEQLRKIQRWREKYKDVDDWYKAMAPKIEGNFSIGQTLPTVHKQVAEQEVFSEQ